MTNPNVQSTWPLEPTVPNVAPDGYTTPVAPQPTPVETPVTSYQAQARRNDFIELILRQVVLALQGFFSPLTSAFDQITAFFSHVPVLGDIVNALTGIPGDLAHLASWAGSVLNSFSPLNIFNLFGVLQPHHTGSVAGGAVQNVATNLVSEPAFRDAVTVVAGQGWSWDNTAGRTVPGSVEVIADGAQNELVSNEIPTTADEVINFSVWCKWSGLTYTGTDPIAFGVTGYTRDPLTATYTELESTDLASFSSPVTNQSTWQQLSGTYTVPGLGDGTIPDVIRMRFKIGGNLTAGLVWWDEPVAMKPTDVQDVAVPGVGKILNNVVNGLENLNGNAWAHIDGFQALVGQNAATVALNTRVNYLESLATTGIKANDLFERVDTDDLGTDWDVTYTGSGAGKWTLSNGHDAKWTDSGNSGRTALCRWVGAGTTISNTDTQKIVGVLGSKAEKKFGSFGQNGLIGRYSSDKLNGIFAYFRADGRVSIRTLISGVETELGFVLLDTGVSAGSSICLLCGTPSGTRFFQATVNGQVVLECNDASSNLGAGYRGWGHLAVAAGYHGTFSWPPPFFEDGQASPGLMNSWSGIDN